MQEEFPTSEFCETIQKLIAGMFPVVWVVTHEEERAKKEIIRAAYYMRRRPTYKPLPMDIRFGEWTLTSGINAVARPSPRDINISEKIPEKIAVNSNETMDPETAIAWVENYEQHLVAVFKDMHTVLKNAGVCRRLRDFVAKLGDIYDTNAPCKTIVIISPVLDIPIELQKSISVIDFKLPDEKEIAERFDAIVNDVNEARAESTKDGEPVARIEFSQKDRDDIINAAKGLTTAEFENACAMSMIEKRRPCADIVLKEKLQIVRKNGILDYIEPESMADVGGMDKLKEWLDERNAGWSTEGKEYGLKPPKGVLLLGIQGCGKSHISRAIAGKWNLPLYKLDIGRLFNRYMGSSEYETRNVLKTIEAVAPSVLLIDEIDKGFAGIQSSSFTDGGTTARVMGTILTWMQDRQNETFIIATSNSVDSLPPELLRKGRFDEIFFAPLPVLEEREDIFKIHIRKINRNPSNYDTKTLAELTKNFSGAEIQAIVETALIKSFATRKLETKHLLESIQQTVPLWETRKEEIEKLIGWIGYDEDKREGKRAVFASSKREDAGHKRGKVLDLIKDS